MNIRIATRKSKLALWQASFVKEALEQRYPDIKISLVEIITEGDKQQTTPLADMGGKSLFVKALQVALLNNEADIAVHSIKDISVHNTTGLMLGAILKREDARDAFVSVKYKNLLAMPANTIIGTSSPRRTVLIKEIRPDIEIKLLRGNVDTRLAKLDAGNYDAIVLAAAGLKRLALTSRITDYFSDEIFTPAIGQGAIGVECRESDDFMRELLHFLHDEKTAMCVNAERLVNQILNGDCHAAIGAHAKIINDQIDLSAMVGSLDGKIILRAHQAGNVKKGNLFAKNIAKDLLKRGAAKLLV